MPYVILSCLLTMTAWTNWTVASESGLDTPLPEHQPIDSQFSLKLGILPHVLLGAEAYSSYGILPWTSSDAADGDRTNTLSYGVRFGTFYAISNCIVIGLEVPYLARYRSEIDAANPTLHPMPPKLGYPNHNGVISLDLHF